jgi:hypothetical protein
MIISHLSSIFENHQPSAITMDGAEGADAQGHLEELVADRVAPVYSLA